MKMHRKQLVKGKMWWTVAKFYKTQLLCKKINMYVGNQF